MKIRWQSLWYPLVLVGTIAASLLLFYSLYAKDNKYTARGPHTAAHGVLRLEMDAYEETPLLFLVDGWEFYQYQFLSPAEIGAHTPDAYVYIGQYAGFEMGNPAASPHGEGTWRLTIFADEAEREYALELPEIYSAYKIWINGALKKVEGFTAGGEYDSQTSHSMLTFSAGGRIEIVVAARDETHYYSGLVYPPAFGAVEQVLRMLNAKLLTRAAACGIALVIALLSLFFGLRDRKSPFPILALLGFSFIAYAGYPLVHMLGLQGEFWYDLERMGYYAFLLASIWLAGRMCQTNRNLRIIMLGIAALICLSVPFYRHVLLDGSAAQLYRYSRMLAQWKWVAALYLLLSVGYAVFRKGVRAKALLAGQCIVAAALVADRLLPRYEPIITGWFGEIAAFLLVCIIMGVLCADALHTYRESRVLSARAALDTLRLESYRQQEELQAAYLERTHKQMHDTRGHYAVLRQYLREGRQQEAQAYIDAQLGALQAASATGAVTQHRLLNAILTDFLQRAQQAGVRTELRVEVPDTLGIEDTDLTRLFSNILDNALEACGRLEQGAETWIRLEILFAQGVLEISCKNTYGGSIRQQGKRLVSSKQEAESHGYGTRIIREIAERLGSRASFSWDEESFQVLVRLHLASPG